MDNQQPGVYDKENEKPITRSDLGAAEKNGLESPSGSSESLAEKESSVSKGAKNAVSNLAKTAGAGTGASGAMGVAKKALNILNKNKKKAAYGGGAIGGIIALIVAVFMMLIPLKLEHIISNLQKHFFSTAEKAVGDESETMLKRYLAKTVTGYKNAGCTTTVDKNCRFNLDRGKGPVGKLFSDWHDARLENALAEKYGIEFKKVGDEWHLKAPGSASGGDRLSLNSDGSISESSLDSEFKRADRATMRAAIKDATANETKWKKVMYRFKVGKLLEKKYGIKRCIVFCNGKDKLADKTLSIKQNIANQKKAALTFLVSRVIEPRSSGAAKIIACLMSDCDTKSKSSPCEGTSDCADGGAPKTEIESSAAKDAASIAESEASKTADELVKKIANIKDIGIQKYIIKEVVKQIMNLGADVVEQNAADAIPVVGWINFGVNVAKYANEASNDIQKLPKLAYIANSASAVAIFSMYNTYASEMKTGHSTASEVGSFTDSLGSTNDSSSLGGKAGAENTPLYAKLIDGTSPPTQSTTGSLADNILKSSVFAASGSSSTNQNNSSQYICPGSDPKPPSSTDLVCQDEILGQTKVGGLVTAARAWSNKANPIYDLIKVVTTAWKYSAGFIIDNLGKLFSWILKPAIESAQTLLDTLCKSPIDLSGGACGIVSGVKSVAGEAINYFLSAIIPNPVSDNMSGGRTFDEMASGADVAGNNYAQSGLGGKTLSSQTVAKIQTEQNKTDQLVFSRKPLYAKIFSTDSEYSFISRLAMITPLDGSISKLQGSISNFLSNPFGNISNFFSSTIKLTSKSSAATLSFDPFGVTQYGYSDEDLQAIGDPQEYWNTHCVDDQNNITDSVNIKQGALDDYNNAAAENPDPKNGMPTNSSTQPCMLIQATIGSLGGVMDSSLLTQSDGAGN
jgi:hypothetical protein